MPSIVITGQHTSGLEPLVRSLGAKVFFQKPFDLAVLLVTVDRFLLAPRASGDHRVQGFTLPSFLQLMEIDGKTSSVRVQASGNRRGELHFRNGKLISANCLQWFGDEAAVEILNWPAPEIHVSDPVSTPTPNINVSLTSLLLRSCQRQDENVQHTPPL